MAMATRMEKNSMKMSTFVIFAADTIIISTQTQLMSTIGRNVKC